MHPIMTPSLSKAPMASLSTQAEAVHLDNHVRPASTCATNQHVQLACAASRDVVARAFPGQEE